MSAGVIQQHLSHLLQVTSSSSNREDSSNHRSISPSLDLFLYLNSILISYPKYNSLKIFPFHSIFCHRRIPPIHSFVLFCQTSFHYPFSLSINRNPILFLTIVLHIINILYYFLFISQISSILFTIYSIHKYLLTQLKTLFLSFINSLTS